MKASLCFWRNVAGFLAEGHHQRGIHRKVEGQAMIHFTCDRCRRVIDSEQEARYVVRMEMEAVMDPVHEDEPLDDRDHLLEIDEILERTLTESDSIDDEIFHKR